MQADITEIPAAVEDELREISKIKSVVSEAVEAGVQSAIKAMKKGRDAAEDAMGEARHTVKQNPLQTMGVVFAAGVLTGALLGWMGSRRN